MREQSSRGGAGVHLRAAWLWRWWPALLGVAAIGALAGLALPEFLYPPAPMAVQEPAAVDAEPAVSVAAQDPSNIESPVAIEAPVGAKPHTGKLANFYNALASIETGTGASPVTVLHLGDSHIASDRITGEVRTLMQARFGDAGRGLMMPGFPFPYYKALGFTFEKKGDWTAANSLTDDGIYGISGVSLTSASADAALVLTSTAAPFASAEVILLMAPGKGRAAITVGDVHEDIVTASDQRSVLRVQFSAKASSVTIEAKGDGPITVLGWSVDSGKQGVRYVNLGIPGASALTTSRFDRALAASDIKSLAKEAKTAGSDKAALDMIASERAARVETITELGLTGTVKPPLSRKLRQALGFVVNHAENPAALVEFSDAYIEQHLEVLETSVATLTAVLAAQKSRA